MLLTLAVVVCEAKQGAFVQDKAANRLDPHAGPKSVFRKGKASQSWMKEEEQFVATEEGQQHNHKNKVAKSSKSKGGKGKTEPTKINTIQKITAGNTPDQAKTRWNLAITVIV
jgi:hypothetical protein